MTAQNYIIALAQQHAGCQIHLVSGLVGAYRAACDNVALATAKGLREVAARNVAIAIDCESALERIGRGEYLQREAVEMLLL